MFQRPVVIPHIPGNLQVNLATPNFPHNNNMYSSGSIIHHTPSTSVNTMNNSNQYFSNVNGAGNIFATPPSSFAVKTPPAHNPPPGMEQTIKVQNCMTTSSEEFILPN